MLLNFCCQTFKYPQTVLDTMFYDVVAPQDNEKELIKMGEKLGYDGLTLLYPFKKGHKVELPRSKLKLSTGFLCNEKNVRNAVMTGKPTFLKTLQPQLMIKAKPTVIYGMETSPKKDPIFSKRAGLTQVSCKLAVEYGVTIGYSLASILENPVIMGRMGQNIRVTRKYKNLSAAFSLASDPYDMRAPHDVLALFEVMGMTPGDAKQSLSRLFA